MGRGAGLGRVRHGGHPQRPSHRSSITGHRQRARARHRVGRRVQGHRYVEAVRAGRRVRPGRRGGFVAVASGAARAGRTRRSERGRGARGFRARAVQARLAQVTRRGRGRQWRCVWDGRRFASRRRVRQRHVPQLGARAPGLVIRRREHGGLFGGERVHLPRVRGRHGASPEERAVHIAAPRGA